MEDLQCFKDKWKKNVKSSQNYITFFVCLARMVLGQELTSSQLQIDYRPQSSNMLDQLCYVSGHLLQIIFKIDSNVSCHLLVLYTSCNIVKGILCKEWIWFLNDTLKLLVPTTLGTLATPCGQLSLTGYYIVDFAILISRCIL